MQLVNALIATEREAPGVRLLQTTPFNYSKALLSSSKLTDPSSDLAITHAWRTSVFHVTTITMWNWNATLTEVHERYETASRAIDHLRRITGKDNGSKLDTGAAYVNEADVYQNDHESESLRCVMLQSFVLLSLLAWR